MYERLVNEQGHRELRSELGRCKALRAGMLIGAVGQTDLAFQEAHEAVHILSDEIERSNGRDLLSALTLAKK